MDRAGDLHRDPILELEDVAGRALVTLRPELRTRFGVYQLDRDAHAISRAPDGALENIADPKFPTDLPYINEPSLERKGGLAGDYEEITGCATRSR